MTRFPTLFLAASLVTGAGAAQATAQAELTARSSLTHVHHFGGFAIVGSSGDDGSTTPVTGLWPASLALADEHQHGGHYMYWDVAYTQTWDLSQSFAVDAGAHTFSASGATHLVNSGEVWGLNCTPCLPTMQIDAQNTQALQFTLSEASRYSFHSVASTEEWVDLLKWSPQSNGWAPVWYGALDNQGKTWDSSGTLQAGLYMLRNNPYGQRADTGHLVHDSSWSYTMTLPDAVLAPVPEPAIAAMLSAGLLLIAGARRLRP